MAPRRKDMRDLSSQLDGNNALNPDVEEDAEAHLEELLEEDKEFRELWESEEPKRSIGTQVLRRRIELGWSQRDLASKLNTSQNRIHLIESGEANPTVKTLYRLAKVLGLELEISFVDPQSTELVDEAKSEARDSVHEALEAARQLARSIVETSERSTQAEHVLRRAQEAAAKAQTWNTKFVRNLLKANESYSRDLFHSVVQHAAEEINRTDEPQEYERYCAFVSRRQENALEALWRSQEQALELFNKNLGVDDLDRWHEQHAAYEGYSSLAYSDPFKEYVGKMFTADKEQEEAYQRLMTETFEAYRDLISAPIAYYAEASNSGGSN